MKVVYTAPNRSHHYPYAAALARAEVLHAFVTAYPRFTVQAALPEAGAALHRHDFWQMAFLASARAGMPSDLTDWLGLRAKQRLDRVAGGFFQGEGADVFLFYNGAGLETCRSLEGEGVVRICEAVNAHQETQMEILAGEHKRLGVPFRPTYGPERRRRVAEYDSADYVLGPSDFVLESFRARGFAPERLLKNPYGMPPVPSGIDGPSGLNDGVFRVLYVGQLTIRKGLRYLVKAFERLAPAGAELTLVGPTAEPTGLEDQSVPENVKLSGVLKGEALQQAYRAADVFVQPSLEEGLSLVVGEAMAHGLPVIATHATGAGEILTDGQEGYLVESRAVDAVAERLVQLREDPNLRERMGEAALEKARHLGGWKSSGEGLVERLREVAE